MKISTALRYLFTVLIVAALVYWAGPEKIYARLMSANPLWLAASLAFLILTFVPGIFGLLVLLNPLKQGIPLKTISEYYSTTWALGTIIPGRLGSLIIVYLLKKENIKLGQSSALFILDKFITLSVLVIASLLGLYLFFGSTQGILATLIFLVMLMVAGIAVYSPIGRKLIKRFVLRGFAGSFEGFYSTSKAYVTQHIGAVISNYFWTITKILLDSMVLLTMFMALGSPVGLVYVIVIYAASAILSFVPLTLNGLGFRESAAIVLYSQIGIPADVVVAVHLVIYFLNLVLSGAIVALFLRTEHLNFGEFTKILK